MSLMATDFRYCLPGTLPTAGWWDRDGFFAVAQMLPPFLAGPLTVRIGEVTAEEDRVWIEAESEAPLEAGGIYSNSYVFALKIRNGTVVEVKEYCDSLPVLEAVDSPQTRGPRKARTSALTAITATVQGPSG